MIMWVLFGITICIIIFGIFTYDKWSRKASYMRNKRNNTGYYWGGKPRNDREKEVK